MQRIDYGNQKATLDALPAADGSPGYYTDGSPPTTPPTTISAGHLNQIQEELCNLLEDYGISLDRANDEQIKTLLGTRIKAIYNSATDTGNTTTTHLRVIIAVTTCKATGARTAVIASEGDGADSVVASGTNAIILASKGDTNGDTDPVTNAGLQSAIAAAQDATIDSNTTRGAVIASNNAHIASGLSCAVIASGGSTAGGSQTALLATEATELDDAAENSAAVGVKGVVVAPNSQSVVLASENTELAEDNTVAGGYSATGITASGANQNLTWKINSATGNIYIDGTVSTPAADFAEYFPRLAGHPEIEAGYFVTLIKDPGNSKRMVAVKSGEGDAAVGIVPAKPGIIGNAPSLWGRYLQDPLGKPILDANGGYQPDPNAPQPGPTALVSLLGQVRCYTAGGIEIGDRLVPTYLGIGRKAEPGEGGFLVLEVFEDGLDSPNVATVLVR